MGFQVPDNTLLAEEYDSDLLLMVAAGDEVERRRAANEFYCRYHQFVYEHCKKYLHSLDEEGVKDLVLLTMQKAFAKWGTYKEEKSLDRKTARARTTYWLFKIADNLFKDSLKSISTSPLHLLTSDKSNKDGSGSGYFVRMDENESKSYEDPTSLAAFDSESSQTEEEKNSTCECRKCLEQVMNHLSNQQREILHLSALYSTPEKELRIPSDILNEYCDSTKTTKENVRSIRLRSIKKIKEYAQEHCPSCLKT